MALSSIELCCQTQLGHLSFFGPIGPYSLSLSPHPFSHFFFQSLLFFLSSFFHFSRSFIIAVGFSFFSLPFSFLKARLGFSFLVLLFFPSPVLFPSPFFYKPSWDFSLFQPKYEIKYKHGLKPKKQFLSGAALHASEL